EAARLRPEPARRPGDSRRDDGERAGDRAVRRLPLLVPAVPRRGGRLTLQAARDRRYVGVARMRLPEHDRVLLLAQDVLDADVRGAEAPVGLIDVVGILQRQPE